MREGTDKKLLSTDLRPQNTIDYECEVQLYVIFVIPIPPLRTPVVISSFFFKTWRKKEYPWKNSLLVRSWMDI